MRPIPIPGMQFREATGALDVLRAKHLEYDVFSKTGYVGGSRIIAEYEPYPSRFFVAEMDGETVGVIRKIEFSPAGFTTTDKMELDPVWADQALTRLNRAYEAAGVKDQLIVDRFDGEHNFHGTVAWPLFDKILKPDLTKTPNTK